MLGVETVSSNVWQLDELYSERLPVHVVAEGPQLQSLQLRLSTKLSTNSFLSGNVAGHAESPSWKMQAFAGKGGAGVATQRPPSPHPSWGLAACVQPMASYSHWTSLVVSVLPLAGQVPLVVAMAYFNALASPERARMFWQAPELVIATLVNTIPAHVDMS